ncbi:MAG TPA: murein biosynthesis integral membrane protein MurJ [Mycobacteriales bacterium]|nr:murein biosynthesis integral membrane protein MurJ [Mycobacteriales bacterium]
MSREEPGGLGRAVGSMAVGTAASRLTGFLRTAVIASAIGVTGIGNAYGVANTAPNIVYELLLGGILTAVVVPLLVRAAKDDPDGGQAYAQRLLSLVVVGLGAAAVLLVLAAPLVVDLYLAPDVPDDVRDLAVVFARFFLPQVLFYGAGAVMGAILNTRGRFGPPMWAPVLNNLVVIATGLVFLALVTTDGSAAALSTSGTVLLGVGTTLGVVVQTVALVPSLRAAGFRFRLRFDLRGSGLGRAARLARWTFLYVVANQLAYLVVVRLATGAFDATPGRSYASYVNAFVLWQLPHAVVAVSVITGLLPRMSRAAADGRTDDLRAQLNRGLRLTAALLVPAAALFVVLGRDVAVVVFARGNISPDQAEYIGLLLGIFALGLVPFSTYQLQLRAFYAMQDTRTPFLVNLCVNAALVVVDVALFLLLPAEHKVTGLAAGHATSFVVGLLVCSRVLSRRIDGLEGSAVVRTVVRCVVAVVPPALAALALAGVVRGAVGEGPLGSLAALAVGGAVLGGGYLLLTARMRVPEVAEAAAPVLRRLRR